MSFLIKVYLIQLIAVGIYWAVQTYINNKTAFVNKAQMQLWFIPFYMPIKKIAKGIKVFIARWKINNG